MDVLNLGNSSAWKWERQGAHAALTPDKTATLAIVTKPLPPGTLDLNGFNQQAAGPTTITNSAATVSTFRHGGHNRWDAAHHPASSWARTTLTGA